MRIEILFRQWLMLGVLVNLVVQLSVGSVQTWFGPIWLWLVVIPLVGLVLFASHRMRIWRAPRRWMWRISGAPQAIRKMHSAR